ncbi:serine hydrolase domain-containing protein [Duganella levis]|uniref:Serine hydrolase n=1 Tax=Duganella levis TaxID=2692169 RepID=A0ABW9W3V7_9BURK|nr:serine hydrolase domain-containing protein [Duganella levis]MYN28704.1 serine hydrolase [Duganella levis]
MPPSSNNMPALPAQHLPNAEDFLMWPPCLQSYGFRNVDRLFASRTIRRGPRVRVLARGPLYDAPFSAGERQMSIADLMNQNNMTGLTVTCRNQVVLENYGLGLLEHERWSTMSMVKSMTAVLVGAAIADGAIGSLDDAVTSYLAPMRGSGYEGVSIRHLLTMSSGVRWMEEYTDRDSDVNRYSRSLANKVPGGVLNLMASLPRAHAPGAFWNYNTGDTYLLGAVMCAATGRTLADYMSEKIWRPAGMEFDAYYTLESADGQEISGSRAGMALRDMTRFAMLVMNGGEVDGVQLLGDNWIETVGTRAFELAGLENTAGTELLGVSAYGLSWWLDDDGGMWALGHSGQRLYINRREQITVVQLAVYPEPAYFSSQEPDRDTDLLHFIRTVRQHLAS